jgi:hypothetical protein
LEMLFMLSRSSGNEIIYLHPIDDAEVSAWIFTTLRVR